MSGRDNNTDNISNRDNTVCIITSMMSVLPNHDVFANILELLTIVEIAYTRRVSKIWYVGGKKCATIYKIGLNKNGWSKWDTDNNASFGWGMCIVVDCRGNIRGKNKNDSENSGNINSVITQQKVYEGRMVRNKLSINVKFPSTNQINQYEGDIINNRWYGTFKLIRSPNGEKGRSIGSGGIMEGDVYVC